MNAYLAHDISRVSRWIGADSFDTDLRAGDLLHLKVKTREEVMHVEEVANDGELSVTRGRLGTSPHAWDEATEMKIFRKPSQELW